MEIRENISLKAFNTFGIEVQARYYCEIHSVDDLMELWEHPLFEGEKLWLGGGSNILLTRDFPGLVIRLQLKGKGIEKENKENAIVWAAAGENWHQFVLYTLQHQLGGLENLSLIPGNVGTAPIQNIGAYGVEIKDHFLKLEAFEISSGEIQTFTAAQCNFGYRDSVFKQKLKGQYIITRVYFKLNKAEHHQLNTSYGAIEEELSKLGKAPSIQSVSEAVVNIRQSKLPDPQKIGNSGSFFKNPVISIEHWQTLKSQFPGIVGYPVNEVEVKLAAGWLIEHAGWKGFTEGDAGVHKNQALVLVNYGKASGEELLKLSQKIIASVRDKFGVDLEAEVNII